jgi:hypothetical protein
VEVEQLAAPVNTGLRPAPVQNPPKENVPAAENDFGVRRMEEGRSELNPSRLHGMHPFAFHGDRGRTLSV